MAPFISLLALSCGLTLRPLAPNPHAGAPARSISPRMLFDQFASQPEDQAPREFLERPLRVAIAGGGVGGLTTALCMLKAGFDVTVYEKTGAFARFGGPIQFASNALSTLKAIDEGLFTRVMEAFTFTGTRRCGIKDGLRADGSFRMSNVADPRYLFDPSVPADWYLAFPLKECADFFKLPYTGVINRPDLQEILLDECAQLKPDFLINGAKVVSYENTANGVTVNLGDGTSVEAEGEPGEP